MSLLRTWRTVRYLKPSQIWWLLVHRARRIYENPATVLRQRVPRFPGIRWQPNPQFPRPQQVNSATEVLSGCLTFVGERHDFGFPPRPNTTDASRLWTYNFHYMEFLWSLEFSDARTLVADYLQWHGPARNRAGWEPYPLSLRLVNWCTFFFGEHREQTREDAAFQERLWREIYGMARWLEGRFEWHLRGNHLLENIIALCVVGGCFADCPDVVRWQRKSSRLLREQLSEQILEDGGHFERSPMYQVRVLLSLMILDHGAEPSTREMLRPILRKMQNWLAAMSHPDGDIVLFNDAALGVYPRASSLTNPQSTTVTTTLALPQSGYYGAATPTGHYVVVDMAPLGPDEQPGHAHADLFTYEMSMFGHRAIVDAGTYDYTDSAERQFCRSTAAHNTVTVGEQDQSEMWGTFRVGRRTRPEAVCFEETSDGFRARGQHNGYARRSAGTHRRHVRWHTAGVLLVQDTVSGPPGDWVSRARVHPDWRLVESLDNAVSFRLDDMHLTIIVEKTMSIETLEGEFFPFFGMRQPCTVVEMKPGPNRTHAGYAVFGRPLNEAIGFDNHLGLETKLGTYGW